MIENKRRTTTTHHDGRMNIKSKVNKCSTRVNFLVTRSMNDVQDRRKEVWCSWQKKKEYIIISINPLQSTSLSKFSLSRSIFGYSHPAPASRPAQIVTPPGQRASYTTFTETRSPLTSTAVGSTADMANPLPLQHANTVCYVGDFSSCRITWFRIRSRTETPSIALSIGR
jgi:hypothetical protein